MKVTLSKLAILDTLLAKKEALTEAEEVVKYNMGHDYSYSQPSQSEDLFGNSDGCYSETDELIRRDQEELSLQARSPVQYPPQSEVEFGFPQTCYCGAQPEIATSSSRENPEGGEAREGSVRQ
ncbi:Myb-like domain-containing protein [Raphanus sativus]|nr:Myb-like domain-containing protein [Raphanus sativus]